MNYNYDAIVIWAGSGGLTTAIGLSGAWKKVALVEAGRIGWDCTNFWCVPSKALIDIAVKNIPLSFKGEGLGVREALAEVRKRRGIFREEESPEWIEQMWITFFAGKWSFKDKNTIIITSVELGYAGLHTLQNNNNTQITAKNIIIATWSHANYYPIDGLDKKDILTNEEIFEIDEDIKELVVVWGGYIGCELAESFANLWVKVTLIQRNIRLIPREEEEASEVIEKVFEQKGIELFTNTIIKNTSGEYLIVEDRATKTTKKIKFSKVLIALGRSANIENLNLVNAWISYSNKWIIVDKYNRTQSRNIFAIWDCVEGNPMFTHWANNEGRGVVRNILVPFWKSSVRSAVLPATLYTNIEVSRVGKTQEELMKLYISEDIVSKIIYFEQNDRSKLTIDEIGFIKINFKRLSWKILWATIVGTKAWDMLPILTLAMQNNLSAYKLSSLVYSYPTKAELIKRVADKFVVGTISSIKWEAKYFFKNNILQIITAIIWISLIVWFFYMKSTLGIGNLEIAQKIYLFVETNAWGPLIYILLYAIRPIVMFPATFMTFMSGALFGPLGGFIYTMIWENMSANFAYFLWRIFWKKLIKPESSGIFASLQQKLSGESFMPILMTRLLFFPFDLVNYAAGILKVKWRWFFLWTFVWIIPWALMFILAWASVKNASEFDFSKISFDTNLLLIAWGLFIASLILAKYLKKKGF